MNHTCDAITSEAMTAIRNELPPGGTNRILNPRVIEVAPASVDDKEKPAVDLIESQENSREIWRKTIISPTTSPYPPPPLHKRETFAKRINRSATPLSDRLLKSWIQNAPDLLGLSRGSRNLASTLKNTADNHDVPSGSAKVYTTEVKNNYLPGTIYGGGRGSTAVQYSGSSPTLDDRDSTGITSVDGVEHKDLKLVGKPWQCYLQEESLLESKFTPLVSTPIFQKSNSNTRNNSPGVNSLNSDRRSALQNPHPFCYYSTGYENIIPGAVESNIQPVSSPQANTTPQPNPMRPNQWHYNDLSGYMNAPRPYTAQQFFTTNRTIAVQRTNHRQENELRNQHIKKMQLLNLGFMGVGTIMLVLVCFCCAWFTKDIFSAFIFIISGVVIITITSSTAYFIKRKNGQLGTLYKSSTWENNRSRLNHSLPEVN